jgi:hypothetical protein
MSSSAFQTTFLGFIVVVGRTVVETSGARKTVTDDGWHAIIHFQHLHFQANTGCSRSATRVSRPASTSLN